MLTDLHLLFPVEYNWVDVLAGWSVKASVVLLCAMCGKTTAGCCSRRRSTHAADQLILLSFFWFMICNVSVLGTALKGARCITSPAH